MNLREVERGGSESKDRHELNGKKRQNRESQQSRRLTF